MRQGACQPPVAHLHTKNAIPLTKQSIRLLGGLNEHSVTGCSMLFTDISATGLCNPIAG